MEEYYDYCPECGWVHGNIHKISCSQTKGIIKFRASASDYSPVGWRCPKCHSIWAPWIPECSKCNKDSKSTEKDILE